VRARVAHPTDSIYGTHRRKKISKQRPWAALSLGSPYRACFNLVNRAGLIGSEALCQVPTVRIYVLAEQGHFSHTVGYERLYLCE
jgi:hypothetical protein